MKRRIYKMTGTLPKTMVEDFCSTPQGSSLFLAEESYLKFTELIYKLLQDQSLTKKQLCARTNIKIRRLTRILHCEARLTIKEMTSLIHALNFKLEFSVQPLQHPYNKFSPNGD